MRVLPWLALLACAEADPQGPVHDPLLDGDWVWDVPPGFPLPQIPEDNPMSVAKVELGRHLFYDTRLSGNETQSCATCHVQALGFADGRATTPGSTGDPGVRNPMALVNIAYNTTQTWANPVLLTLEQQVAIPLFGEFPVELGVMNREEEVYGRLAADPVYQELFADAFPEEPEPTTRTVVHSLAAFVRSLVSADSPVDRYTYHGDPSALSASALRGMDLFFSEALECHHCHGGFNFSQATMSRSTTFIERPFHNTGLYDLGDGAYPPPNTGVHELTGDPWDMGRFRPPSLRNVAVTGPYMHDGSVATLEEVLDIYARGGRLIEEGPHAGDGAQNPYKSGFVSGFSLSQQDRSDLLAFLHALTDDRFLTDPAHADPWIE